jgi:uncharacterized protein (TIGR02597 family)
LLRPALLEAPITVIAGPVLTLNHAVPTLPTEGAYAFVLTGSLEGAALPITAASGANLSVAAGASDLALLHPGDTVAIVPYWTLDTAFPLGRGVTASTSTTAHATEILVYDDTIPGENLSPAATYYYFGGGGGQAAGWYKTGSTAGQGTARLAPLQYFVARNNTAVDTELVATGAVQMAGYRVPVAVLVAGTTQDNLLALPVPLPMTLDGIGLHESGAVAATTSLLVPGDEVLLYDNTTTVLPKPPAATYFYFVGNSSRAAGWYKVGATGAPVTGVPLNPGEGLIVRKKSTTTPIVVPWVAVPSYLQ